MKKIAEKKYDGERTPAATRKAMSLLLRMDRTEKNLREKLREKEFSEEEIEEAVRYVKSFHYLDDERYAATYIRAHEGDKSLLRLRQDLSRRGVEKDLIDRMLAEVYEGDEEAQIKALLQKKQYSQDLERKEKERIYAFLLRRGFPSAKILRAMRYDAPIESDAEW